MQAHVDILENYWRLKNPEMISAYVEDYQMVFQFIIDHVVKILQHLPHYKTMFVRRQKSKIRVNFQFSRMFTIHIHWNIC